MAGKTSEKPNPLRAAPAMAIHGACACHSRSMPRDSTERQIMAMGNPPKRLMVEMKSRRATMKATPNAVRQRAALFQCRLA